MLEGLQVLLTYQIFAAWEFQVLGLDEASLTLGFPQSVTDCQDQRGVLHRLVCCIINIASIFGPAVWLPARPCASPFHATSKIGEACVVCCKLPCGPTAT